MGTPSTGPARSERAGSSTKTYAVDRLAAVSDGVFAICLTLLVLELKIPEVPGGGEQQLVADLAQQLPNIVGWIVSFILIARFWIAHHAILARIGRCHAGTMVANFAILALISLIPFGASLVGTYEFDFAAVLAFSAIMAGNSVALGIFASHIHRNPHLHRSGEESDLRWHILYHNLGIPAFAAVAVFLAWIHHPATGLAAWVLEPLIALGLSRRA